MRPLLLPHVGTAEVRRIVDELLKAFSVSASPIDVIGFVEYRRFAKFLCVFSHKNVRGKRQQKRKIGKAVDLKNASTKI
jgi:hypothetical protein